MAAHRVARHSAHPPCTQFAHELRSIAFQQRMHHSITSTLAISSHVCVGIAATSGKSSGTAAVRLVRDNQRKAGAGLRGYSTCTRHGRIRDLIHERVGSNGATFSFLANGNTRIGCQAARYNRNSSQRHVSTAVSSGPDNDSDDQLRNGDDRNSGRHYHEHQAKVNLYGMGEEALREWVVSSLGQPAYRAKQIRSGLYTRRVSDIGQMTDLPAEVRSLMMEKV